MQSCSHPRRKELLHSSQSGEAALRSRPSFPTHTQAHTYIHAVYTHAHKACLRLSLCVLCMLTYICVLSMHARVEQRKGEGESGAEESEKVREGRRQKKGKV